MQQLLAKPVAEQVYNDLKIQTESFVRTHDRAPKLAVILVGTDPASIIYTRKKGDMAIKLGMRHETITFNDDAHPDEVKIVVERLNQDPQIDGILIQRPLPKQFKEEEVLYWVSPQKDVDAFHPENAGRLYLGLPTFKPCTPAGIMRLLKYYQIPLEGKLACVIGRSSIVGKPMSSLLLQANATVIQCHSKTKNLRDISKTADILIVAAGQAELVDETFVKPGAVVIDVGIHRTHEGKVVGDVLYSDVAPHVSGITPVPGGVGPMTIAMLMQNTLTAGLGNARKRLAAGF